MTKKITIAIDPDDLYSVADRVGRDNADMVLRLIQQGYDNNHILGQMIRNARVSLTVEELLSVRNNTPIKTEEVDAHKKLFNYINNIGKKDPFFELPSGRNKIVDTRLSHEQRPPTKSLEEGGLTDSLLQQTVDTYKGFGHSQRKTAAKLGLARSTVQRRLKIAEQRGLLSLN
jgi:hypothetical protein